MADASNERSASKRTRTRMLACGRRIVARSGLRGLTVRGVAAQAKVNLGTFVYHFGTRDGFITELMENWYAPLYAQLLNLTVDEECPPLERLRRFLLQLAAFMAENRRFLRNIMIDAAGEEQAAIRFIQSLLGRHPLLLFRLIREAQQAGELRAGDPVKTGIVLFGATLFPSLWGGVLLPDRMVPGEMQPLLREFAFAPAEIGQRFEWVLQGLVPLRPAKAQMQKLKTQGKAMNTKRRRSKPEARP
jgi:AcrR family transcriptional regulator